MDINIGRCPDLLLVHSVLLGIGLVMLSKRVHRAGAAV